PRPRYAIPFLVGALVMLYATGRRRLEAWGPSGGAQRRFRDAAGRHARWLAAGSLALALLAPGILPGLAAGPLVDVAGPIETQQATVSPIVDIRPSLTANRSVELFRVRSERPAYWRLLSLDRFDGRFWTAPERVVEDQMVISGPSDLPVAEPALHDDGDLAAAQDGAIEQEFEILGLRAEWLPSAYLPVMSTTPGLAVWDPREATLRPVDEAPRGYRYRVWSHLAAPTPADLRAIPRLADSLAVDASLPVATPPRVYAIAEALTRGEETPYEKLLAIQDHLRTFAYDEAAPPGHGTSDILFFLERSRRGYCEQFAGTMAVLARALGYRARVAIGFTPGNPAADGSFVVTSEHVHAWTEVYFPSIGWLAFEPTPARTNPVAGDYADPAAAIANPGGSENDQRRTQNREAGRSQRDANEGAPPDPNAPAAADRTGGMSRWWMLAALPLVPVGVAIARLGRRAMRRRRARTDRDRILAAYEGFTLVAEDLGFGRRDGETPAEFAARLRAAVPFSDGHLERLSALAVTALYSERTTSAEAPAVATEAERAVVRDLRRHAGAARSFAGTLGLRR
ncbi:MAG TPA: DUF3488 and transglutaminase-like domain-containing protein, partial [Actinomycetota bacterium]|nr:DUF3488 and transglutaminase-like domain-containing protein [Actinomycetota bacterium]